MNTVLHIRKNVLGVTQSELGLIAGAAQGVVSRWERGELFPDLAQLKAIRTEVLRRGFVWDDAWFFEAPASEDAA
jgi:predicted transcriptional regulator